MHFKLYLSLPVLYRVLLLLSLLSFLVLIASRGGGDVCAAAEKLPLDLELEKSKK